MSADIDSLSIASVELDGEALNAFNRDDRLQGLSIPLPMRDAPPWELEIRLVGLSGQISDAYLLMELHLPQP